MCLQAVRVIWKAPKFSTGPAGYAVNASIARVHRACSPVRRYTAMSKETARVMTLVTVVRHVQVSKDDQNDQEQVNYNLNDISFCIQYRK